ncbi:hypothetical protein [Hymenobacter defluvii]|uniref:Uncharacterized protein n=1 Tax=Hymenobacter defluvii TaxID=2054411 RepID=A0ABS3TIS5_9BACT|nr:hypothetical protein [Hymenobacter defluvii]MBO3273528.1 hypothetical protein [Hymenobacter defluvii]
MGFLITLPKESVSSRIPFLHPAKKTALAYNALLTMLIQLEAVTHRLHERVLNYSQLRSEEVEPEPVLNIQITIAEVWEIMDAMRRAQRFWPIVKLPTDNQARRVMDNIKAVRDSFQHLDERLEQYFQDAGDSVFGDIYWRYRPTSDAQEEVYTWATGVTIGPANFTKAGIRTNDERFLGQTGVYDFNLIYIERELRHQGKKLRHPKHKYIQISLDEAAAVFNQTIHQLDVQSKELIETWQKAAGHERLPIRGLPPVLIRLK